jgi:hypothetical protein
VAKYEALRDYLMRERENGNHTVDLSFGSIDRIVGGLPRSARSGRTWWANGSNSQAMAWRAAGWHVDAVDMAAQQVRFAIGKVGGTFASRGREPAPRQHEAPQSVARYLRAAR